MLAGIYAATSIFAWVLSLAGLWQLPLSWPPAAWHAHEMVFGFCGAAVAGFLLTAVPSWTNSKAVSGPLLGLLVLSWFVGRAAMWGSAWLPGALVLVLDSLHLPLLAWVVLTAIVRARNLRNYVFIAMLAVLLSANLLSHAQAMGAALPASFATSRVGVWVLVLMITLVSGRIVPTFTRNYLRLLGGPAASTLELTTPRGVELASIFGVLAVALANSVSAPPLVLGGLAGFAAIALLVRAAHWGGLRSWRNPIVWVLHVGHGWLVVAMVLFSVDGLGLYAVGTSALHALTAGAIGTMILGVMSRAALGHTGRPLHASRATVAAYLFVTAGAAIRVFGPLLWPTGYLHGVVAGGTLWALGFALYVSAYTGVLTSPRPDGREG